MGLSNLGILVVDLGSWKTELYLIQLDAVVCYGVLEKDYPH